MLYSFFLVLFLQPICQSLISVHLLSVADKVSLLYNKIFLNSESKSHLFSWSIVEKSETSISASLY